MSHRYLPQSDNDIREMLSVVGCSDVDELYADIPESIRFKGDYDLPQGMSEMEVRARIDSMGAANRQLLCFAGAGVYDHYTPAVVADIVRRSEYLTSYTPYQAEISQGTLHCIFEYQTMMARLTGMDVSNASMYDGTTASAEAMLMSIANAKKANRYLVSETVDKKILDVILTYAHFHGVTVDIVPAKDGVTDSNAMAQMLEQGGVAGVMVQQPNRFGIVEDYTGFADTIHQHKALLAINSVAFDLALLKTPGEWGADIAVGDGQSLGIPMSFGGPYVGYMCTTEKLVRKMPGRVVGMTKDSRGQRAFVLTLQAREQHIRRQKATSNICSNQSLMALYTTVYMSVMGKEGLKEAAQLSYAGAHYLYEQLIATQLFTPTFQHTFFNEFCVDYKGDVDKLQQTLIDNGIFGGIKVDEHTIMFAVTEKRTKQEVDRLIEIIKSNSNL